VLRFTEVELCVKIARHLASIRWPLGCVVVLEDITRGETLLKTFATRRSQNTGHVHNKVIFSCRQVLDGRTLDCALRVPCSIQTPCAGMVDAAFVTIACHGVR
jgi:hypothetical protein